MGQTLQKCCDVNSWTLNTRSNDENAGNENAEVVELTGANNDIKANEANQNKTDKDLKKKIYHGKYEQLGKIGQGGFSKVFLVRNINNGRIFALKKVSKRTFNASENSITIENVMNEKNILLKVNNPFIIKFYSSFQDDKNLYYVMEYAKGGSITKYLQKQKTFAESVVRYYSAEILLGLKALHYEYDVIYRDLKPDNILLAEDGHIKVTDFGLSTIGKKYSTTGCGTPEFIAPEILNHLPHSRMIDYWSFGCMLFLFLYGRYPFYDDDIKKQYEKIKKGHFTFPEKPNVSQDAKNLIKGLLKISVTKRLGFNGIEEIMEMKFYNSLNWNDLYNKKNAPPLQIIESKLKEEGFEFSPITNIKVENFTYDPELQTNKVNSNP